MQHTSKDLLYLERKDLSSSSLESPLLVFKKNSVNKDPPSNEKPIMNLASKSPVLGRVKDFLGVFAEANKKLELDAKDNAEKYNIEVLDGSEKDVIVMDLMLGIADLHTPEAVAAAESAIISNQPVIPLTCDSSSSSSSESESEDQENNIDSVGIFNDANDKGDNQNTDHSQVNHNGSRSIINRPSRRKNKGKRKLKKKPKILELS